MGSTVNANTGLRVIQTYLQVCSGVYVSENVHVSINLKSFLSPISLLVLILTDELSNLVGQKIVD